MDLSHEDSLRLNVLLAQDLLVIRIDDSAMIVYALTSKGEAKVKLMPNCRDDLYLRYVRELFSAHVSDSPGGYPVYIKLWTRMGQTRTESLRGLLLLGVPEAIIAVANAPGLSEKFAHRAWWALPTAEIARSLLNNSIVSKSEIGRELAQYLLEFLPFETDSLAIVESVRLVLQPGLIDEAERLALWRRGVRKNVIRTGFLQGAPDSLPEEFAPHKNWDVLKKVIPQLSDKDNLYAIQLMRLLSGVGQHFLEIVETNLGKVSDQSAMVAILNSLDSHFISFHSQSKLKFREFAEILECVNKFIESGSDNLLLDLLRKAPVLELQIRAMLTLACVGEKLADSIFSKTDAVGSLMRKKLLPVSEPLVKTIHVLIK